MRLVLRFIGAVLIALILCQVTFVVVRQGLRNFYMHQTERLSEIFKNNTKYELLFLGSSRTHTTIHPGIVDSICQVHSYNAGIEGGNIYEFKLALDAYLVNHPAPEYLVLTLDLQSLNTKKKIFNYTQYLPYIDNPVIAERLKESGYKTSLIKLFPFLEMTAYDDHTKGNIVRGWTGKTEIPTGDYQYKGFLSNTIKELNPADPQVVHAEHEVTITSEGLQILNEFIRTCQNKNIHVIFTYAPEYKKTFQNGFRNKEKFFETIAKISHRENIPFLRHDELALCQRPELFANPGHVNKAGAVAYSTILAEELRSLIGNIGR